MTKALGIDIGGSAVKGAPVDIKTGRLLGERFRIETPQPLTPSQMARAIAKIAAHFKWKGPIGIGFPGVVAGSHIRTATNLHPKFIDCDGVTLFAKATGCPVALLNDGAAAAIAEMHLGAGRGFMGKALLLTLGTGIGTALAYRGVVVPMELGHLPHKGQSWEKFAAASVREREELSWKAWAKRLDKYIEEMEALLWPELIIIGGGVSAKHEKYFEFLKPRAKLVPAEFLNQAGIAGAAMWGAEAR